MKLSIEDEIKDQLDEEARSETDKRLASYETRIHGKVDGARAVWGDVGSHLVVGGNVLLFMQSIIPIYYRLDQYCIRRDGSGKPLEAVILEKVSPVTLSDEVIKACEIKKEEDKDVEVYTVITWQKGRVKHHQEINDKIVPKSEGDNPVSSSPWIPLRWKSNGGESYGRSIVMDYYGDLLTLETLSKAIVQFAEAASKIVFFVNPNGNLDIKKVAEAESGDVVTGKLDDIGALQLEKVADFQVAKAVADDVANRLSHAFLLRSGSVRNAERVTAEEIRAVAQELEDVLGGVYTTLSVELQLPYAKRLMTLMQRAGELPNLPKGVVEPVIITGFAALGRNHASNRIRAFIADAVALAGPNAMQYLKVGALLKAMGTNHGIESLDDYLKTDADVLEEQRQAQTNDMLSNVAPAVIGEASKQAFK